MKGMMQNRFPGKCYVCREDVEPLAGYYVKGSGAVHLRCHRTKTSSGRPRLTKTEQIADARERWSRPVRKEGE